jgi:hypothetical protein
VRACRYSPSCGVSLTQTFAPGTNVACDPPPFVSRCAALNAVLADTPSALGLWLTCPLPITS